jgi:hypothetical protein
MIKIYLYFKLKESKMTIYIDIILLENIVMNYIIILATAIISKARISIWKSLMASGLGGIYSILNYMVDINNFSNLLLKIFISIIMIQIAFGSNKLRIFFKQLIMFYLVSFTFGGVTFMLLFFLNPQNLVLKNNHLVGMYPIKVTLIGGAIGFVVISIVAILIKNKLNENSIIYDLEILQKNINISNVNTTRFGAFCRCKNSAISSSMNERSILVFTVKNEAGALAKTLNIIGSHGFNMISLRSRPMKELIWNYYFYVEVEGCINDNEGKEMIKALSIFCDKLKVVGTFKN